LTNVMATTRATTTTNEPNRFLFMAASFGVVVVGAGCADTFLLTLGS